MTSGVVDDSKMKEILVAQICLHRLIFLFSFHSSYIYRLRYANITTNAFHMWEQHTVTPLRDLDLTVALKVVFMIRNVTLKVLSRSKAICKMRISILVKA